MENAYDVSAERFLLNRSHDILSSKWKVYIIYVLGDRIYRFGELRRQFPYISRLSFTRYLQELERDGLLSRTEYSSPPLKTEYSLTPMGLEVYPIISELIAWGEQ